MTEREVIDLAIQRGRANDLQVSRPKTHEDGRHRVIEFWCPSWLYPDQAAVTSFCYSQEMLDLDDSGEFITAQCDAALLSFENMRSNDMAKQEAV